MKISWTAMCLGLTLLAPFLASAQVTTEYIHTDSGGTPIAITNESGFVTERFEHSPFGERTQTGDGPSVGGHVLDGLSGLVYMQQRYYDPSLGIFLSGDPFGVDADTGANFGRYKYASNNPFTLYDPDGRQDARQVDRPLMERVFPKGDLFRTAGEAMGALSAYGAGLATGDEYLRDAALDGMRENVSGRDGVAAAMMAVSPRSSYKGGLGGAPSPGAPDFIVAPNGTAFPVPKGATGPTPVINPAGKQTGVQFTGGRGGENGNVATMRIMDPVPARGKAPAYPNGYIKYENAPANGGPQGVNPYTGKTVNKAEAHHGL